jgi:hypothetical protein
MGHRSTAPDTSGLSAAVGTASHSADLPSLTCPAALPIVAHCHWLVSDCRVYDTIVSRD